MLPTDTLSLMTVKVIAEAEEKPAPIRDVSSILATSYIHHADIE